MRQAKRFWPKHGLWRFVLLLFAAELLSWLLLSAWDAWHPRYEAAIRFQTNIPRRLGRSISGWGSGFNGLPARPQPTSREVVFSVHRAAEIHARNHQILPAPPATGYFSHRYLLWKTFNLFNQLSSTDTYDLAVTASDSLEAARQAESALKAANLALNEAEAQAKYLQLQAEVDDLMKKVTYARQIGEPGLAELLGKNLSFKQSALDSLRLEMEFLSWSAFPDQRTVRTFFRPRPQTCILGTVALLGFVWWWKRRRVLH